MAEKPSVAAGTNLLVGGRTGTGGRDLGAGNSLISTDATVGRGEDVPHRKPIITEFASVCRFTFFYSLLYFKRSEQEKLYLYFWSGLQRSGNGCFSLSSSSPSLIHTLIPPLSLSPSVCLSVSLSTVCLSAHVCIYVCVCVHVLANM